MLGSTLSPSLAETVFLFQHAETNLHTSTAGSLGRSKMSIKRSVWASSLADLGFFVGRGQRERVSLAYVCMYVFEHRGGGGVGRSPDCPATRSPETGTVEKYSRAAWCGSTGHGRKMQMEKMVEGDHQQLAVLKGRLRTWWD
jgi:hypothetical protein